MDLTDIEMDTMAGLMRRAPLRRVRASPGTVKRTRQQVSFTMKELDPAWQSLSDKGAVTIDYEPTFCAGLIGPYYVSTTRAGTIAFNARWDEERRLAFERQLVKTGEVTKIEIDDE